MPAVLSAERFAHLMAVLGPFEPQPAVAVAVSGGSDSMALALLLGEWAAARNGRVEAITVDHGLRPESAEEARTVGRWLAGRPGLSHSILAWRDEKPATGLQAAARAARYRLLAAHCRAEAILHLCVGHHFDDQVETHDMRAQRASGAHGLAGMNAVRPLDGVRLLRPLLGVPKQDLQETLRRRGQAWIEDPSNQNPLFERARMRAAPAPPTDGSADRQAQDRARLHRLARGRDRDEAAAAALLAERLTISPDGWAGLDLEGLEAGAPEAAFAFAAVLRCIGGAEYPISPERSTEALQALAGEFTPGFTLGGCDLRRRDRTLQISRDWGAIQDARPVTPGARFAWDRRFEIAVAGDLVPQDGLTPESVTLARLGERGILVLGRLGHPQVGIPEPARKALPALWRGEALLSVPNLGFGRGLESWFRPAVPATSIGFTVAY